MFKRLTRKRLKNLLFGFTGTAIHCPYCKSLHVRTMSKSKIEENEHGWDEQYYMKCQDCGADAKMQELWVKPIKEEKGK